MNIQRFLLSVFSIAMAAALLVSLFGLSISAASAVPSMDDRTEAGINATVIATVPVGWSPAALGVNPATNRIYVAHQQSTMSVINGASNTVDATVTVLEGIINSLAVNPVTNRIYVGSSTHNTIRVINGENNRAVASVTLEEWNLPGDIGVNPVTNRIYVGNISGSTVSVIDGASNAVTSTVTVGSKPQGSASTQTPIASMWRIETVAPSR